MERFSKKEVLNNVKKFNAIIPNGYKEVTGTISKETDMAYLINGIWYPKSQVAIIEGKIYINGWALK